MCRLLGPQRGDLCDQIRPLFQRAVDHLLHRLLQGGRERECRKVGHLDGRRGWDADTLGERDLGVAFSGQDIFQVKHRLDRLLAGE